MSQKHRTTDEMFFSYPPLLQTLLKKRGLDTFEKAEQFLNPDYKRDIGDPFLILNMDKAVNRILHAIDEDETIVVYGDYDCDGIPGSVVLHDFFKKINYKNFRNYIPHRHNEGYGLNSDAIDEFGRDGVKLLITVDCGIADVDEVDHANRLGIDVIVTDHHLPQETLPRAYAVLNSKQEGDTYHDNMLCGAGLAWKLVQALVRTRGSEWEIVPGWEKWLLDMAGLSTVADMVPLQKENRAIAYYGLKVLRKSPRPGLMKLLRKLRIDQRHLSEEDIGFALAPRINAASRMSVPFEAFELLSTEDETTADVLSDHLIKLNETRKGVVAAMIKEAKHKIESRELREIVVVGNPAWRPGVLGLAANKLMEDYERPVFVWGREDSAHIKGSCRSDGTVNVVELMANVSKGVFLDVGGHELSGGFSVSHEHIHFLEKELLSAYKKTQKRKQDGERAYIVDEELTLRDVSWDTYRLIEKLAPFGIGNPKPVFLFKNVRIVNVKMFGKEKNHLELVVGDETRQLPAIGFFTAPESYGDLIQNKKNINLVATVEKSNFKRIPELRLRIVDVLSVDDN